MLQDYKTQQIRQQHSKRVLLANRYKYKQILEQESTNLQQLRVNLKARTKAQI